MLGVRGLVAWPRRLFVSAILRIRRVSPEIERRLRRCLTDQSEQSVIGRSGLFDTDWYLAQNPDVASAGINPLVHYLRHGAAEGRGPNPLFDTDWYLAQNSDVAAAGINPLVHYLRHGAAGRLDPNPLFDTDWYLAQNPDVAAAGINPLAHYLRHAAAEGRDPNPLFDTDWYLAQNPDVAAAGINPLVHYLRLGAEEGHDPNPSFDTDWYLAQNPDVAAAGINPLVHYLRHGAAEGRDAIHAAAEFPEGLSFFRIARRHRLGYVIKTGEHPDAASSHIAGLRPIQAEELQPSCRRGAKAPDDRRIDVIVPIYRGLDETHRCIESVLAGRLSN